MRTLIIFPVSDGATGASAHLRFVLGCTGESETILISPRSQERLAARQFALFPQWATRNRRRLADYFAVFWQELSLFAIPVIVLWFQPNLVLIHSSFLNRPSMMSWILRVSRSLRGKGCHWVLDVRDCLMRAGRFRQSCRFDRVIACSESVVRYLESLGISQAQLVPVSQEDIRVDPQSCKRTIQKLDLDRSDYLLYCGAVKPEKGLSVLLDAWASLSDADRRGKCLVIVGLLKCKDPRFLKKLSSNGVRYIPAQPRNELWHVMSGSLGCINISPSEGMPRVSLEAMMLGKPVLLPDCVPEFVRSAPEFTVTSEDVALVANAIRKLISKPERACYPMSEHDPARVKHLYSKALWGN